MFYQEKNWPEKTAAIKKFEYLPLGNELKKVNIVAKKQYKGLYKVHEFDKKGKCGNNKWR